MAKRLGESISATDAERTVASPIMSFFGFALQGFHGETPRKYPENLMK